MKLDELLDDAETRAASISNIAAFIMKETDGEVHYLGEHPTKEQIAQANKIIDLFDRIGDISLMFYAAANDLQHEVSDAMMLVYKAKTEKEGSEK